MSAPIRRLYQSPPQIASELGVQPPKIIGWIHSGELHAVNVANRGSKRPRWRISRESLAAFLMARSAIGTQS